MTAKDQFYFTRKILSAVAKWKAAVESAKWLAGTKSKSLKRERAYAALHEAIFVNPLPGRYDRGILTMQGTCTIVIDNLGGSGFSERLQAAFPA